MDQFDLKSDGSRRVHSMALVQGSQPKRSRTCATRPEDSASSIFGVVLAGLMFGISNAVVISKGSPQEGYLINSVLAFLGLFVVVAWVSRVTRTVGPFGSGVRVKIHAVTAALRKHYVKMPWFSYVPPTVALWRL